MKTMVSLQKQSKKAQRAYHNTRRSTWGELKPTQRVVENRKAYNRKRVKQEDDSWC